VGRQGVATPGWHAVGVRTVLRPTSRLGRVGPSPSPGLLPGEEAGVGEGRTPSVVAEPERLIVFTDGACLGNPGPGGWAWAVEDGPYASGSEAETTNQRMELRAALEAIRSLPDPLRVVSDSSYLVNCFRDRWWAGWERRGWRTAQGTPVANQDLWRPLVELVRSRRIELVWVKGHAGVAMNELVDRLATEAARLQAGRQGHGRP